MHHEQSRRQADEKADFVRRVSVLDSSPGLPVVQKRIKVLIVDGDENHNQAVGLLLLDALHTDHILQAVGVACDGANH